jgi:hypothetical protein
MSENLTLEEVEHIVDRLSTHEKLKLMSHIRENISEPILQQTDENQQDQDYLARMDAFLDLISKISAKSNGSVDSAEDIRQIREERMSNL